MSVGQLDEAMRYGTHADYDDKSLGHFGLGLKTASLSQCRRLTVASRARGSDADRHPPVGPGRGDPQRHVGSRADPEHVGGAREILEPMSEREHGTVVLWEHLDRVHPAPSDATA